MSISKSIESYLSEQHINYDLVPHPKSYTSHDTATSAHVSEDHIAKAVIVESMNDYAMAVIPGSSWLKLRALNKEADRDYMLADESEVEKLFADCDPGAVPPLGSVFGLETFLDDQLSSLANVYFESGDHEHLIHVKGETFRALQSGVRHGNFCYNN